MKQTIKHRIVFALGATSLGPIVTAVIQIVSVPVFLHSWGPKLYGEWLLLSAIPVYLGLTDFGFGSVAGNDMTMEVARGNKTAALEVFQSAWLLTTAVSLSFGLCVALGLLALPVGRWLNIALLSGGQVGIILAALCVYVLFDLQFTVIASGFRCDGNYALGTLLGNIDRFLANGAAIIAAVCHGSPVSVALTLASTRLVVNLCCQLILRRKSLWLHYGYAHARLGVVRKLFGPAIAWITLGVGNSFLYQGMIIMLGWLLGPVVVVMFATVRTMTRLVSGIADMIGKSIWAELSVAFGAGNTALARKLHRYASQASLGLSIAAIAFLTLFGARLYGYWTRGKVPMDHRLFYLLLIDVLVNSFWSVSSIVSVACNRHERQAIVYVLSSALSLPVAYLLIPWVGLSGAGVSLLLADMFMMGYVLRKSLSLLHDNPQEFLLALLRAPFLGTPTVESS